jgi:hypothetical protein
MMWERTLGVFQIVMRSSNKHIGLLFILSPALFAGTRGKKHDRLKDQFSNSPGTGATSDF